VIQDDTFTFRAQTYRRGLLVLDLYSTMAMKLEPQPSAQELIPFAESLIDSRRIDPLLSQLHWREGDCVTMYTGSLREKLGYLLDVSHDQRVATVDIHGFQPMEIHCTEMHRVFEPGDHVKVIAGGQKGRYGIVTSVLDNRLTFLEDAAAQPVSDLVSSKYL
jgi:transcription elongation factor